jgi:hypothetical protein
MHVVQPLPHHKHLTQLMLVGYNGYGKPMAFVANPEDVFFLHDRHHPPSASIWMVPEPRDGE